MKTIESDIVIAGAGPAGLAFARSLAGSGLSVALIERQSLPGLAHPASDGREIALTHHSVGILRDLGAWEHIDPADIAPLRGARVLNGGSPFALSFDPEEDGGELGQLVSNHHIRRALFRSVVEQPQLHFLAGTGVISVKAGRTGVTVMLSDGRRWRSRLLVAADSRFSAVRTALGIGAEINRLGRSMMVCRVDHERDHAGLATEWFAHGQTIAMLPLNGRTSSAVLTASADEIGMLETLDRETLGREITRRYESRLGTMRVVDGPHVYPLATTWARHFAATRAALIGDAAVGMHPVTAHGFNLGLRGQKTLATLVRDAAGRGGDIASPWLLRRYEVAHRLASRPLYAATNLLVRLYTDERSPARLARHMVLRAGNRLPLVRGGITQLLMQD
ncbi:5-demethoxyubiquinol-8 5-hydroxylase UbiM [Sphingomonas abietis]|uniref:5-demethoxyubiquinol-8 5-hydroxylase UbiM n=1 Tax=Sphingomonas abietis TaxID=3012344 RepID=A0ABY7NHU7_9SPHN|nr:5-demethoxyubiquinol-8 5-hydroxylase UbiM [Sphingomonas abietis]WBO21099.1 5-demethoxyubiquinol-8 5-hydroxylase UbiM [Sphingomonas abietis]